MGTINAQCTLHGDAPWTIELTTPSDGKLSNTIVQLKAQLMEHMNECLAAQGASTADDLDVMEETVSDDDTTHQQPSKKNKQHKQAKKKQKQ